MILGPSRDARNETDQSGREDTASPVLQLHWPRRWHVGSTRVLRSPRSLQKLRELALCDTHSPGRISYRLEAWSQNIFLINYIEICKGKKLCQLNRMFRKIFKSMYMYAFPNNAFKCIN